MSKRRWCRIYEKANGNRLVLGRCFGCMGVNAFAEAEAITPRYDSAVNTNSSFTIFENGTAIVSIVDYTSI